MTNLLIAFAALLGATTQPASLRVTLDADAREIVFHNQTDCELVVVKPVDGAGESMRAVYYTWEVTRDGKPLAPFAVTRCGNVNGYRVEDFIVLAPRAATRIRIDDSFLRPPEQAYPMRDPGEYTVWLHYHYDRQRPELGLAMGEPDAATRALLERAEEVQIVSDPVAWTPRARPASE